MAVQFESATLKRNTTQWVDYPKNIDLDPDLNGRHESHTQAEIEALAADILANGQHSPVLLRKQDNGRPILVYGHRRWEAVALLNSRGHDIQLLANYEAMDEVEAFTAAIGENRFRKDVSPIDDAANIKILTTRFKKSIEDIAKIYFPEAKTEPEVNQAVHFVKQRQALIELAPEAAKAVRAGTVKITAAVRLSKMSKDAQRERLAASNGNVRGKDAHPPKSKATTVKQLVASMIKALDKGIDDVDNTEYEWLNIDRKKFKKLVDLVGAR